MKTDMHDEPLNTALYALHPLDEEDMIQEQLSYFCDMSLLLDGLLGVVVSFPQLPPETCAHFVDGIAHLRGHIDAESRGVVAERKHRRN